MVLIRDASPKKVSGGYILIFGNEQLGQLMSRVQSAVISSGRELENLIKERIQHIENIDEFISNDIMPEGVFVASKSDIKKSKSFSFSGAEPDFVIFKRRSGKQNSGSFASIEANSLYLLVELRQSSARFGRAYFPLRQSQDSRSLALGELTSS